MPQRGRLTDWNDARGFGYITPLDGRPTVFVHISEFPRHQRRPYATDLLSFETSVDERGRTHAINVRFLSAASPRSQPRTSAAPTRLPVPALIATGTFGLAVCLVAALGTLPWSVPLAYVVMSSLAFLAYAQDKRAAQTGQWRTGEGTLILLGLLAGWPGALIAQETLRHKTRKQPFRSIFWASVLVNIGLLVWLAVAAPLAGQT